MGRLKKDHSGWHTSGLYLKYQSPQVNEQPLRHKAKKDTSKWCKGKVGIEHDFILVEKLEVRYISWKRDECIGCGKKRWR